MSKRTQALQITPQVRKIVWERDKWCILCGKVGTDTAHYISKGSGGLGIEQNLVLLCRKCHMDYDQSGKRLIIKEIIKSYLKIQYSNWDESKLKYRRKYE